MRDEDARQPKPFLSHLEDLRRVAVGCAVSLAVGMAVAVPLAPWVVRAVKVPLSGIGINPDEFLRVLTVSGGFAIAMKTVFWTGVLISMPLLVFQIGSFIFPGLTLRERKAVISAAAFATLLFAGGVLLGYLFAVPVALRCLFQINDWIGVTCAFVDFGDYVAFVLQLLACFGIVFELPVVLLALGAMGLVTSAQLRDKRRHAIVALLGLAMVLTPSTDIITMLIMAVPLIGLYEFCIWALWIRERRRRESE